jgi:hypothetical protein
MLILIILSLASIAQADGPSVDLIERALLDRYEELGGVSCEFEGRGYMSKLKGTTELGREQVNFSGSFAVGAEKNAVALEVFHFYSNPKEANNNFHKVVVTWDGKRESLSEGPYGSYGGEVGVNWAYTFNETGSLERVIPINAVRCFFEDKNYEARVGGIDAVGGRPCYKLEIHSTPEITKKFGAKNSLIAVYWIDLERGAHALKIDLYFNRMAVHSRVVGVNLRRYKFEEREFWLPVEGKLQMFDGDGVLEWTEYYQVLQSSVRVSQLPPDRFKAKFKPGTIITDHLRQARFEFGQDLRQPATSRAEAGERLLEHLSKADAQKTVLDASRVANEGVEWSYILAASLTLASVLGLSVLLLRRGRTTTIS